MSLSPAQEDVINALLQSQRPLTVGEVSEKIGRTKSPTNRILLQLVEAGRLERMGRHPDIAYRLCPFVDVDCMTQEWAQETGGDPTWARLAWSSPTDVDWRFPLVSRIKDSQGRQVARSFLEQAWKKGYLTPWLLPYLDPEHNGYNLTWAKMSVADRQRAMRDASNHGDVTFIVFGSTARGDARRDSDLDMLIITPVDPGPAGVPQFDYHRHLGDLADAINLGASRQLDLIVVSEDDLYDKAKEFPEKLARSIAQEGITVFTTDATGFAYVERWGRDVAAWREASA